MARLVAFPYYGGKSRHLSWLLPLLPECGHFIEPFCGSCSVLLNRTPSKIETINDIDSNIVNFFKMLRDRSDELIRLLNLTPYSREEFVRCQEPAKDSLEQARRTYVRLRQGYSAIPSNKTKGQWSLTVNPSAVGSPKVRAMTRSIDNNLDKIVDRLRRIQIDCDDALTMIKHYDHSDVLFYCDPPYIHDARDKGSRSAYVATEMADIDHIKLSEYLHNCRAKVAISGYQCDLYNELYQDWYRHDKETITSATPLKSKPKRVESLWTNYEVREAVVG